MSVTQTKKCYGCGKKKSFSRFSRDLSGKDGLQGYCKACCKNYKITNIDKIKEGRIRRNLKNKYSITPNQYDDLLIGQGGKCAICEIDYSLLSPINDIPNNTIRNLKKGLFIDHDHITGRVRGLLCFNCNTGLGFFKDDPKLTAKTTEYLLTFPL